MTGIVFGAPQQPTPPVGGGKTSKGKSRVSPQRHKFTIGPDGFDEDEALRWRKAMTVYPNLADDPVIAQNAVDYVRQQHVWFEQRMMTIYTQWQVIDQMLRGNSVSLMFPESDLHSPELYKAVETLTPRLVEAILEMDPWFHVYGRDREDRTRSTRIQAWLEYLIEQDGFSQRIEPIVRDMLTYKFFALKTRWDVQYREQIVRDVEKSYNKKGEAVYDIKAREEMVNVFEGLRFDQVDPYDFICDLRHADVQRGQFVGDRTAVSQDILADRAKQEGWVGNWEEVLEQAEPQRWLGQSEWAKYTRSLDSVRGLYDRQIAQGQPKKVACFEFWATWRPTKEHPFEEYVITVLNGTHAVRVQKNPHDDKHRPYVVGRSSKSWHDFLNVGVLDHAVKLNMEKDEHRNIALRGHAISQCPPIFADGDVNDLPRNLLECEVGQIIPTRAGIHTMGVKSTIGEMQAMDAILDADIQGATGAFQLFDQPGGTATEIDKKTLEANRRTRQLIYNLSDGLVCLLKQGYSLSQQFLTHLKGFRVMGAEFKKLNQDYEIGPEDLQDPVDFEIRGLRGLQSHGTRATQIAAWMNMGGPMIQSLVQRGLLNDAALFSETFEIMFGYRLGENILQVPDPLSTALSQDEENEIMSQGVKLPVHEADNDAEHLEQIKRYIAAQGENLDRSAIEALMLHADAHMHAQNQKRTRMMARMQEDGPYAPAQMATPKEPGGGRYDQKPDLTNGLPPQNSPGETPGPARLGSIAAPDRASAIPQSENRQ